ncbi:MAG TPA: prepilin-type N-terminal cleavage/methylation domain-containing protein [Candidatus Sulfotelmatobacter sp.]|nr:prepilin-type N-terminal cleavage/methylation domain-containing protein [Candidatus Sulfotelmatobacter sp.]
MTPKKTNPDRRGFTLIELLVVISIIGILAGFSLAVLGSVKNRQRVSTARAELTIIESALSTYQAKYSAYPPGNPGLAMTNQLYFELTGVTVTNTPAVFTTLDGATNITQANYSEAFNTVAYNNNNNNLVGVVNCSKGGGEDAAAAKTFLSGFSSKNIGTYTNANGATANVLVTAVGGPDAGYLAGLAREGFAGNPFRYVCPGVRNPSSYDLWVQLVIKPGVTNLVCNWSSAAQVNTSDP